MKTIAPAPAVSTISAAAAAADKDKSVILPGVEEKEKNGERRRKTLLTVLIWALVIGSLGFLTLFLSYRIGRFDSIPHMLDFIQAQF